MEKLVQHSFEVRRQAIRSRAICMREIFVAYFCIRLVECACLFPAVWLR